MGGCSSRAAPDGPQPEAGSAAVTVVKEKKTQPDAAQPGDAATEAAAEATAAEQREQDRTADDAGSSAGKQEEEKEEKREAAAAQPELEMKAEEETKESSGSSAATAEVEAVTATQAARLSTAREITPRAAPAVDDCWPDQPPLSAAASSSAPSSDAEFRNTVRSVLVLLLDRLTRTLEYEKAAFQELAVAVGHSNYLQLFDYAAFEAFLRANFTIAPSPSPQQQDTDLRYLSQYFSLFLTLAGNATAEQTGSRVFPSRVEMTLELQRLCSETSAQLLQWCSSPAASVEAVEHLRFFSQAMQFARGDLVHNPHLLQKNIDDICD